MNLILIRKEKLGVEGRVLLRGRQAEHVREVLRARPGDRLRVGVVRGPIGIGTVETIDRDSALLQVTLDAKPPVVPTVDVILAVPRPKVLPRVLETLSSFGVRRIDLCNAWRVDKSYLASHRLQSTALTLALTRGCEQGATTWVPDVELHPLLVPFLEGVLAPRLLAQRHGHKLILHPRAALHLEDALRDGPPEAIVALGPEGGWIEAELASFAQLGFVAVNLGPPVLRVEAAAAALLGQLTMWQRLRYHAAHGES